jgi:predicted DNA-binding antitoxin AbrB/MazE fold protein
MSLQVEVIYENGMLKPSRELPLQEGQKVTIIIQGVGSAVQRFCGSLRWTRDPEELHRYLNDPDESSWNCHEVAAS